MSKRLMYTVGLLTLLSLAACSSSTSDDTSDGSSTSESPSTTAGGSDTYADDLEGTSYGSTATVGRDLVADSTVELTFSDGQMTVIAGCNTIGGSVEVIDGTLAFSGEPRSTMMACSEDLTAQDQFLIGWFTDGVAVTASALGLTLAGGEVTIEFTKGGASLASDLMGPVWTLETTTSLDEVIPVPASVRAPTLEFAEDGGVTIFAGCNSGGTTATTTEDMITFQPVRLTEMACEEPAMALEAAVTAVLDADVTYVLEGKQLTITKGSTALTFAGS